MQRIYSPYFVRECLAELPRCFWKGLTRAPSKTMARMSKNRVLALPFLCFIAMSILQAQDRPSDTVLQLDRVTSFSALPNGIDLRDGEARMQVIALRQDLVRIRVSRSREFPEDASWAVLQNSKQSRVAVQPATSADTVGFQTEVLRVSINRQTFALTISDRDGNILQQDARPIEFYGTTFRVCKRMPVDEHYFGLGDKTGPLDRRGQAFTLWNTDAYSFQESTDPIYKSIPFFIAAGGPGGSYGMLLDNTWRTWFDFGRQDPQTLAFGSAGGPIDYYLIYGPSVHHVVERYTDLTGKPPLTPVWALGFQQSR